MNARRTLCLALVALAGCTHRSRPEHTAPKYALVPTSADVPEASALQTDAAPEAELPEIVILDEDEPPVLEGSYILRAPVTVRTRAAHDAGALGVLAVGTRLPRHEPIDAAGCRGGWVPVQPQGFACIGLEVVDNEPRALVQPVVRGGAKLPTVYGRVRKTATVYADPAAVVAGQGDGELASTGLTVERRGSMKIAGTVYWRTRHGLIPSNSIRRLRGSSFAGVTLEDEVLPVAWTIPGERRSVAVLRKPSRRARSSGRLPAFTTVSQPDLEQDPDFVHVTDRGWVSRKDVRVALPTQAPPDLESDELWLDVNLDEQTLVAYRGEAAVFATLVSTGKARYETPTGEFRIGRKVAMRTMNSRAGARESYAVDKVPWTAYFKDSYALHTAYWHDGFGRVRSHGCVNLSPADAKRLYGWMGPHAAPGWREVYATDEQPGTRVVIRGGDA